MAEPATHTEVPSEQHEAPAAFGIVTAPAVVALAVFLVIVFLVWKKVPAAIGRSLDKKIAAIREQLDEAESLRKDAEALKAEYQAKAMAADKESATMVERAKHEAEAIIAKAAQDAEALVERRKALAESKIAAEERAAIDELRATAARAATAAAASLIGDKSDAKTDKTIVDQAITGLSSK